MTDDLTTLLRDAGRGPTIDLDVDAVHSRGRRRAAGRRVAVGAGALALLGVLGAGVATLLDAPETPIVDQGPSEVPAPSDDAKPDEMPDEGTDAEAADRELAASLGVATHRFVAESNQTRIVRATPDGAAGRLAAGLDGAWSIAVTAAGDVWVESIDGGLLAMPAGEDAELTPVTEPADGSTWRVLGPDGQGEVLLGRSSAPDGERFTVHRSDGPLVGDELQGLDVLGAIEGDGQPWGAASGPAAPEELVVLDSIGETYAVTHMPQGGTPTTLLGAGGLDDWLSEVALVGRDVWVLESGTDGDVDVLIRSLDAEGITRAATPIGRDFDGHVLDLTVAQGTNGPVAVLAASSEAGDVVSWIVDTTMVTAAAAPSEPMQPGPAAAAPGFARIDLPGRVLVTPVPQGEGDPGALAACATDEGARARLNSRPAFPAGTLWFLCWDAMGLLDGAAHPYVPTERFAGGDDRDVDATTLLSLVRTWADGPTAGEADAGLSGGVEPEVATIEDVAIVGDEVTVDLAGGAQVGVLSTTTGRATFVQQLAGMVFQFDGPQTMAIRLDGSCEAWSALVEADPGTCRVYDESHAPWAQGDEGAVR